MSSTVAEIKGAMASAADKTVHAVSGAAGNLVSMVKGMTGVGDAKSPLTGGRILFVVSAASPSLFPGEVTGWYWSELAHPFHVFQLAGFQMDLCSETGTGTVDTTSVKADALDAYTKAQWESKTSDVHALVARLKPVSQCKATDYRAVFYVGGHATLVDFPSSPGILGIGTAVYEAGGVVAAVCHGPAIFGGLKLSNGRYLLEGKTATGFSRSAEEELKISGRLAELHLKQTPDLITQAGGIYSEGASNWGAHVVTSERVVSGKNPASATGVAEAALRLLETGAAPAAPGSAACRDPPRVVFVVTSASPEIWMGKPTGYFWSELAHPFHAFQKAGFEMDICSETGSARVDEPSILESKLDSYTKEQWNNKASDVHLLVSRLKPASELKASNYRIVYFVGGHGCLWDLPTAVNVHSLAAAVYEAGGVVAAVCHGPAVFGGLKLSNGRYLVENKHAAAFSRAAEAEMMIQRKLEELGVQQTPDLITQAGGIYSEGASNWGAHVVTSERVVSGKNPASATGVAEAAIRLVKT